MSIEQVRKKMKQVQTEIMNRRGGRPLVLPENRKNSADLHIPMKKASLTRWRNGKREVIKLEYSE